MFTRKKCCLDIIIPGYHLTSAHNRQLYLHAQHWGQFTRHEKVNSYKEQGPAEPVSITDIMCKHVHSQRTHVMLVMTTCTTVRLSGPLIGTLLGQKLLSRLMGNRVEKLEYCACASWQPICYHDTKHYRLCTSVGRNMQRCGNQSITCTMTLTHINTTYYVHMQGVAHVTLYLQLSMQTGTDKPMNMWDYTYIHIVKSRR